MDFFPDPISVVPSPPVYGHITPSDMPTLARPSRDVETHGRTVFYAEAVARKKETRRTPPPLAVEFTAAAHEHVEPAIDVTRAPTDWTASSSPLGPFEVPAYGYMRHLLLQVTASGGVAGTVAADGPWSYFREIALLDVNGAPIYGPVSGYQTFLANVFGGYAFVQDPRLDPDFTASPTAFQFMLRIPVEINHNNGLGALGNQNAAATYRVRLVVGPLADFYSANPTTNPTVRIRGWLEAWSVPTPTDLMGRPQETAPPRHGTTQYWSVQTVSVAAGQGTVRIARVGNLIRTLIFIARATGAGARSTTIYPDPAVLNWDNRQLINEPRMLRRKYASERNVMAAAAGVADLPAGVFPYQFSHDVLGHAGDGTPELWLPTVQSSRIELTGIFTAGDIEVLTNDVAPVEIQPDERYVEFSETGFTPERGQPIR